MSEPEICPICRDEIQYPKGVPDCCQHAYCYQCIHRASLYNPRCPLDCKPMRSIYSYDTFGGPITETFTISDRSIFVETNERHEANDWLRQLRVMLTYVHSIFSDLTVWAVPEGLILIRLDTHNSIVECIDFFFDFRAFFEANGTVFRGEDQRNYSHTMQHLKDVLEALDNVYATLQLSTHTARLPIREQVTDFEAYVGYVHHYMMEFLRYTEVAEELSS